MRIALLAKVAWRADPAALVDADMCGAAVALPPQSCKLHASCSTCGSQPGQRRTRSFMPPPHDALHAVQSPRGQSLVQATPEPPLHCASAKAQAAARHTARRNILSPASAARARS